MSVLFVEGFDHLDLSSSQLQRKGWIGNPIGGCAGRIGGSGISVIPNNPVWRFLDGSYTKLVAGFALRTHNYFGPLFWMGATIDFDGGGHLVITDSAAVVRGTATGILNVGVWYYLELLVDCAGGTAELRVDGATVIAAAAGNYGASIDQMGFTSDFGGPDYVKDFDDVYVADIATGGTYFGDVIVETLYPRVDGAHTDWHPDLVGADHYTRVNEHQADGDLSTVRTSNAGDRDSYLFDPLTAQLATIYAVQLSLDVRKNETGLRQIKPLVRQDGVDTLGPLATLPADYTVNRWMLERDPTDTPWTGAQLNADEFGIQLIT